MKTPLLELQNIGLAFNGLNKAILHNVNYRINAGEFVILLGSNGSGKSSLLKLIDRRYRATKGLIKLNGENIAHYAAQTFCNQVITLTQNCADSLFPSLSVLENCILSKQRYETKLLRLSVTTKERDFFENYLQQFNANLAGKLSITAGLLSGGEQQALALALSVLSKPKILLLDEHTSALDPQSAARLMQITEQVIREHRITCILSTHDLDLALNYGDRILALGNGAVLKCIELEEKRTVQLQDLLKMCY